MEDFLCEMGRLDHPYRITRHPTEGPHYGAEMTEQLSEHGGIKQETSKLIFLGSSRNTKSRFWSLINNSDDESVKGCSCGYQQTPARRSRILEEQGSKANEDK